MEVSYEEALLGQAHWGDAILIKQVEEDTGV